MTITYEDQVVVSPELAKQWLDSNQDNRSLREAKIRGMVRDIQAGRWHYTGESIKFDTDGFLLDGQHRLTAIVRAGVPVTLSVHRGLQPIAREFIDSGTPRSAADVLKFHGFPRYRSQIATVARLDRWWRQPGNRFVTPSSISLSPFTKSELTEWADKHQDVIENVIPKSLRLSDKRTGITGATAGPVGFALWRTTSVSPYDAERFWSAMETNSTDGPGDPRYALMKTLQNKQLEAAKSPSFQLYLFFKAWNEFRYGVSDPKGRVYYRVNAGYKIERPK